MTLTIGVDVGGTKVAGGVVDEHGTVLASNRRDTPAEDPAGTRDTIVEVAAELAGQFPQATAIGIGAAAWIDAPGDAERTGGAAEGPGAGEIGDTASGGGRSGRTPRRFDVWAAATAEAGVGDVARPTTVDHDVAGDEAGDAAPGDDAV